MNELFNFLYRSREFIVFVLLELLCLWLIISNNSYQSAVAFSAAREVVSSVYTTSSNISNYMSLDEQNQRLMRENARLYERLQNECRQAVGPLDSAVSSQYEYIPAKVINNSILNTNNYITINKGSRHGLSPGMGIITTSGVVGKIKACSENFSVAYSVLHAEMMVSSRIKKDSVTCFTKWNMKDYKRANVKYVGRHVAVKPGDTIVTSGFNTLYPENYLVGIVKSVARREEDIHLDIEIELSTDFSKLSYVYVIKNKLRPELDSLQKAVTSPADNQLP